MVQSLTFMKVIIISGLARGGTNVLWNAIQSHPAFCSPVYETNEILRNKKYFPRIYQYIINRYDRLPGMARKLVNAYVSKVFHTLKMANLNDPFNKFKTEHEEYTREELDRCNLVLKGVTSANSFELRHTEFLNAVYPAAYNLRLIRNGYAVCEGWTRRGSDARKAGLMYRKFGERIIEDSSVLENYKVLRYEDLIADIFGVTEQLFLWTGEDTSLQKIRLKTKRVVKADGSHEEIFGKADHKYWVSAEELGRFIDVKINEKQIAKLSSEDIRKFEAEAAPVLRHFGYNLD